MQGLTNVVMYSSLTEWIFVLLKTSVLALLNQILWWNVFNEISFFCGHCKTVSSKVPVLADQMSWWRICAHFLFGFVVTGGLFSLLFMFLYYFLLLAGQHSSLNYTQLIRWKNPRKPWSLAWVLRMWVSVYDCVYVCVCCVCVCVILLTAVLWRYVSYHEPTLC